MAQAICGAREETRTLLGTLCTAAQALWQGRLKEGVTPETCPAAFSCAAAFTAAADLTAAEDGGEPVSFSAGELSIKTRTAGEAAVRARELRAAAERLMEPYAVARDFAFRGVRG